MGNRMKVTSPASSPGETGCAPLIRGCMTTLAWGINWDLPRREFQLHIRDLIDTVVEKELVIALPIPIIQGTASAGTLGLVVSQIDCSACTAPCCRQNVEDKLLFVLPTEHQTLSRKYGDKHFRTVNGHTYIQMPCPFLVSNKCSIHEDRPSVCVLYPFQPGANDETGNPLLALDSRCPEARRITMRVYTSMWEIQQRARSFLRDRTALEAVVKTTRK